MKIMITGATGFLGNRLAMKLAESNHKVHALVRNLKSPFLPVHKNIILFRGDLLDKQSIARAMKDCEQVYHVAAVVTFYAKDPDKFYRVNVAGTENILAAALENNIKKLVFTSSAGVIGHSLKEPLTEDDTRITSFDNDYEITKSLGENLVLQYCEKGLFGVIVNPTKIFGLGPQTHNISVNSIIRDFIKKRIGLCPAPSFYLSNYVYIEDAIQGHIIAMERGEPGERYILGGENISFKAFFESIKKLSGHNGIIIPIPRTITASWGFINLFLSKILGNDPYFTHKGVKHIYCNKAYSSEKAIKQLGYRITPFEKAISETIQYLKSDHEYKILQPYNRSQ
jgi:nucleoside-diphosphate-sugar epimerase